MSTPRQAPRWSDVFILIEDLRARIEKLETPSTGTLLVELERENAELHAQLTEARRISQVVPLLMSLFGRAADLPPGDWTENGKYRAVTAEERLSLPEGSEYWREAARKWEKLAKVGRPAFDAVLYRVPVQNGGAS